MSNVDDIVAELEMDISKNRHLRRRAEEYEYWRKRAGWFDDDVSMKEFNNGVYDTYYQIDDDTVVFAGGKVDSGGNHEHKGLSAFLKVASIAIALAICILLYRAVSRRSSSGKSKSKKSSSNKSTKSRSDSKSRSGRNSSSRSRAGRSSSSRSRSGRSRSRHKSSSSNYELMDDKTDTHSRKSSRSRSRSRRSRSRAGSRSRSKSKSRSSEKEVVLV